MSEYEEKKDLLLKLKKMEKNKGITFTKHFNQKSTLEELRVEYEYQNKMIESEAGIKFMRNGLIFMTSGAEYLNKRYDPIGAKLDGWGENIMENIMDYDGVFERLHEKYYGSVEMQPEVELLMMLVYSGVMFHMSKTFFTGASPQFENVLREKPGLVQEIFNTAKEAHSRENYNKQQQQQFQGGPMPSNMHGNSMQPPPVDINSILGSVMGNFMGNNSSVNPLPRPVDTREMRDPPMNEMYRKMMEEEEDALSVSSETSERIGKATIIRSTDNKGVIKI